MNKLILITITILLFISSPVKSESIYFELDSEMEMLSDFIKTENFKVPKFIADKIAYEMVSATRNEEQVSLELLVGIIRQESNFDPMAVSRVGARGLMQVYSKVCGENRLDNNQAHNIKYNIEFGICILKDKLRIAKGNEKRALYYYVGRDWAYVTKVLKHKKRFLEFIVN